MSSAVHHRPPAAAGARAPARARGQAMTEFIIVFPVLLLLVLGALQFALIYQAKTAVNYATFLAARAGALNNARMIFIENAFARGLAPLYTHMPEADAVVAARDRVRQEIEDGLVQIRIINPTPAAFTNFGIPVEGGLEIPNDNLMYRPPVVRSGMTVQDANLLKIEVTYCYPLYVPFIDRTIVGLLTLPAAAAPANWLEAQAPGTGATGGITPVAEGTIERTCLDASPIPRLPIRSEATIRMQSPPFESDTS